MFVFVFPLKHSIFEYVIEYVMLVYVLCMCFNQIILKKIRSTIIKQPTRWYPHASRQQQQAESSPSHPSPRRTQERRQQRHTGDRRAACSPKNQNGSEHRPKWSRTTYHFGLLPSLGKTIMVCPDSFSIFNHGDLRSNTLFIFLFHLPPVIIG